MRTGAELSKAIKPFTKEQPLRTWWGVLSSLAVHVGLIGMLFVVEPWWGKAAVSIFIGLSTVRLFCLYHDYEHGAIFRGQKLIGKLLMEGIGWYTLCVPSVWKESHNYHHVNNARLTGSAIGSYPTVSVGVWKVLKPKQRKMYKMVRSPLWIGGGLLTSFVLGMVVSPFMRDKKKHWSAPLAAVVYLVATVAIWAVFGWEIAVFGVIVPGWISSTAGAYLFYAQHNFPDAAFRGRREWEYQFAALNSSSMFKMSRPMHWFTANIGYHHVHHLSHMVPWYRLPEAMEALPELQSPGCTSWSPTDIMAAFRCSVWDAEKGKMVTFQEADDSIELAVAAK
jgi:omega-6 fatty acid desaturase (delta-12 desaturase)